MVICEILYRHSGGSRNPVKKFKLDAVFQRHDDIVYGELN